MGLPDTALGATPNDRESTFFRDANGRPAIVDWCAPLKLEMMNRLFYNVSAVRGLTCSADVSVDDQFSTPEWGAEE